MTSGKRARVETTRRASVPWGDIALGLIVIVALAFSFQGRIGQYAKWRERPDRFFADGLPLVTSLDGYYWLRLAEDHRTGVTYPDGHDPLRSFPDGTRYIRPTPLLSLLLAWTAAARGINAYEAGVYLIPALAGLFIVPLVLYFRRIGLPAAGVLGGLLATFSWEYFTRTSVGGVDTDALIFFFLFLGSLFLLLAAESKSFVWTTVHSGLAGFTMLLFHWWYYHPGFTIVYLGLLVLILLLRRADRKTFLASVIGFVFASNPLLLWKGTIGIARFVSDYVFGARDGVAESTYLPGILGTVTEFQREAPMSTLALVLDPPFLALGGLLLFGYAAIRHWRRIIPLLPILVLGLLAPNSGRRFVMFLAPFVGIGYGYLVTLLLRPLVDRLRAGEPVRQVAASAAALVAFALFYQAMPTGFVPLPTLSASTISTVLRLKDHLPENAVVLTWWDYGYALTGLGRFATYHDGSYHRVNTYLIARALSSTSQAELHGTAAFINRHGSKQILEMLKEATDPARLLVEAGNGDETIDRDDVHVVLFEPMVAKYAAIHQVGSWDPRTGAGAPEGYQELECHDWTAGRIACEGLTVDTQTGHIGENVDLQSMVFVRNGRMAEVINFPNRTGVYLQVLANDEGIFGFYLLNERVFRSNFNQLYFLGRPDPALFEEVYSDFPIARAFRLKSG